MSNKTKDVIVQTIVQIVIVILTVVFIYVASILLLFLQKYFFVKPGEVFYNSEHLIVLALGLGLIFWYTLMFSWKKVAPNIWRRENEESEKKGIDLNAIMNILRWGRIFLIFFSVIFLGSFNNYIKLSNDHIIASSWSWLPWNNERQYSYSDVTVTYSYRVQKPGLARLVKYYDFRFSDDKRVFGILQREDLIDKIQQKQKDKGFVISKPKEYYYWNSLSLPSGHLIVFMLSAFLMIRLFYSFRQRKTCPDFI